MKFTLNISNKLWIGYGVLLGFILISVGVTYSTLIKTSSLNNRIHEVASPSVSALKDLKNILSESEKLISVWISNSNEDIPQKNQMRRLHSEYFPIKIKQLKQLCKAWDPDSKKQLDTLLLGIDTLLRAQHELMITYDERESYFTPTAKSELQILHNTYSNGDKYEEINFLIYKLEKLIKIQEDNAALLKLDMDAAFKRLKNFVLGLGVFFFVFGCVVAYFITSSIVGTINQLKVLLSTMGQGILPQVKLDNRKDELGQINRALFNLVNGLKSIVSFSKSIGNGNFDVNFKPLSVHDDLGNNLLHMRNNLKRVAEEDFRRNWTTAGLAKFSELLRVSSDNVTSLSENLITELVRYLKANQGGVFVINDIDPSIPFLEMKGCFAWDRQKFIDQKIYSGDGLIGQCWQERDTIYITDVPSDYIKITSGLGKALPKCILLVPMVANDKVFGVLEIASFQLLEKYEIDFVELLAESTATTISSTKVNEQTKKLLRQAQYSSEQLQKQEEEMRLKQIQMDKNQEMLTLEIGHLKKKISELSNKYGLVKDENEVLQNLILKFKKEIDSE